LPDGSNNLSLAFVGDDTLVESILKILKQKRSVVELHFGEPAPASGLARRELTEDMRRVIAALLNLPVREAPEKVSGPQA
jgi:1-acyl-sn-glycerol-3-phosphate acyltransferase